MLLEATTIHKDIVKVYNYILVEHINKDLFHQLLKVCWGVGKPEGHCCPLKETIAS